MSVGVLIWLRRRFRGVCGRIPRSLYQGQWWIAMFVQRGCSRTDRERIVERRDLMLEEVGEDEEVLYSILEIDIGI